ncbi:glycosyltransferase [Auraticoccus monumenti]|uniref:glycosyltransferase n=1 Tax=Auraticoccus monumenti TaxID=675864 RepID=UPI0038B3E8FB
MVKGVPAREAPGVAVKTVEGGLWVLPQVREACRRGAKVTVITPTGEGRLTRALAQLAKEEPGVTHVPSPYDFTFRRPWRVPVGLFRLRRLLRRLNPDASSIICTPPHSLFGSPRWDFNASRVHGGGPLYLDAPLIRWVERFLSRLDDVIICGSEHTRRRYPRPRASAGPTAGDPYGVDLSAYEQAPQRPSTESV